MRQSDPTKESGIDGIETNPEEIAAMALYGLVIKEVEVETLAKGYMALREALERYANEAPDWLKHIALKALDRPE